MKKTINCTLLMLLVPIFLFAQDTKGALLNACSVFSQVLSVPNTFHMAYDLSIIDKVNSNTKHTDVYKTANAYKLLIGDEQQILYTPGRMLVVNTDMKLLHYSEDTATTTNLIAKGLFSNFLVLIDSAKTITVENTAINTTYTLIFGANHTYQFAKFTFNKSGTPLSINCRFNQNQPEQTFYEMNIQYTTWEQNIAVEAGFPGIENYIVKNVTDYKLVQGKEDYKLFQSLR